MFLRSEYIALVDDNHFQLAHLSDLDGKFEGGREGRVFHSRGAVAKKCECNDPLRHFTSVDDALETLWRIVFVVLADVRKQRNRFDRIFRSIRAIMSSEASVLTYTASGNELLAKHPSRMGKIFSARPFLGGDACREQVLKDHTRGCEISSLHQTLWGYIRLHCVYRFRYWNFFELCAEVTLPFTSFHAHPECQQWFWSSSKARSHCLFTNPFHIFPPIFLCFQVVINIHPLPLLLHSFALDLLKLMWFWRAVPHPPFHYLKFIWSHTTIQGIMSTGLIWETKW